MNRRDFDILVVGGSSGSIPVLMMLIDALPEAFTIPVVIVLHRLKNVESDLKRILSAKKTVTEPEDKDPVTQGGIYLAPQNYHLLVEENKTFSLDYSEAVNYSRPSIDVSFESIADVYKSKALAILLSGANKDGSEGMKAVIANGGVGIVQDPLTAAYRAMPDAAIKNNGNVTVLTPEMILNTLLSIWLNKTM